MFSNSSKSDVRPLCFILLFFGFYMGVASLTTLWDRDEPRFARAAVEMLHTGDYLVPYFNGDLRPDKPPLIYWCMNPWIRLWGATDLAVRMPSIIGSLVMALATFHIGRNLGGAVIGQRALWLLLCMPLPLFLGTAATADGILLAGVSVSLAVLVDRLIQGQNRFHVWILAFALTWALLAKGPVGLAAFWLGVLWIPIFGRGLLKWDRRWWWEAGAATLVALLCFFAWGIPANEQTGGELARLGWGRHVFQRISEPLESHGGAGILGWLASLPFYLPVFILGAAPTSALLLPGFLRRREYSEDQRRVWLILSTLIVPVFLLMTLVATKLPHYVLSSFPGVAVAGAWLWSIRPDQGITGWNSRVFRVGRGLTLFLLLLMAIFWTFAVNQVSSSFASAIPAVIFFLIGAWSLWSWNPQATFFSFRAPGGTSAFIALGMASVLWGAGRLESDCKVAQPIREMIQSAESPYPEARVSSAGYFEPSLVYALDAQAIPGEPTVPQLVTDEVRQWLMKSGPAWLVTGVEDGKENIYGQWFEKESKVRKYWQRRIFNYSNGRWTEVTLWLKSS